jgi:hypothetical protein
VSSTPGTGSGPGHVPLKADDVRTRLSFARRRIDDLLQLNRGDLLGADGNERQRLTQEVFFHLVGAIEVFAQLVNEQRKLGAASEDVSISRLPPLLGRSDPLVAHVEGLYANTRKPAPTSDPYSGDRLMYRIWNYRHQVTHRRANPFLMRVHLVAGVGVGRRSPREGFWFSTLFGLRSSRPEPDRSGHFLLDPREPLNPSDPKENVSERTVHIEVDAMFALVEERLEAALAAI